MAKQSFKRYITKLFQVAGVRVETDFTNMQDNDFVVISRNNSGKTSSRTIVGDAQFYLRWDDFVAFLQGATTDKFVVTATLVGTTINFAYNNLDPGFAVNLDPLGIITGVSFSEPNITFARPGTDFVVDISTILNSAIVGAALVGTALRFTLGNTSTFDVELSSLQDGVVDGGSLAGDDLVLTRSLGGDVPNIDISGIKDGVVDGGSVSGTDLILTRSIGGDVPAIDLSPALTAGVVQQVSMVYTRANLDAMSASNRFLLFDNGIIPFMVLGFSARLESGTVLYATDIDLIMSYGAVTSGVEMGRVKGWYNQMTGMSFNSNMNIEGMLFSLGNREVRIHHEQSIGGDNGDYSVRVNILYANIT